MQEFESVTIVTTINNIPIQRHFIHNLPYNPALKKLASVKRKESLLSEIAFWREVRNGNFYNIDFDRQRIIGNYIVDFYVKALALVVEVDGVSHETKVSYDLKRENYITSFGIKVFRVSDIDVLYNLQDVMKRLECFIIANYGL